MKTSALRVLLATGAAVLCVVLVGSRWREGEGAHAITLSTIVALGAADARLDEDVMKAQMGLLTHFDGLVASQQQMHALLAQLEDGLRTPGVADSARTQFKERLDALDSLLATKDTAVERFKTELAVLRNSLAYFPPASRRLTESLRADHDDAGALLVEQLTLHVALHVVAPTSETAQRIEEDAAALGRPQAVHPPLADDTTRLVRHAREIKDRKVRVEELVARVVSLPARDRVDALWRNHQELEAEAAARLQRRETWLTVGLLACLVLWLLSLLWTWRAEAQQRRVDAGLLDRLWQGAIPAPWTERVAQAPQPLFKEASEVSVLCVGMVPPVKDADGVSAEAALEVHRQWLTRVHMAATQLGVEVLDRQGATLLLAAGFFTPMVHHAEQVARLALRLLDEAAHVKWPTQEPLQVRLGIHCAPVKAGVELAPAVRFLAFGDGVEGATATMMAAVPGQVLLTNHARSRLVHLFGLKESGAVTMAGVGAVPCFALFTPGGAQPALPAPTHG